MLVAISGNIGSGKTTLANFLSNCYGFSYIPNRRFEFEFIDDFFNDIEKYFFPAQVSFLLSKAIEIQENFANRRNMVVDRSLLEDADVFARLWVENRNIEPRIAELYRITYEFIIRAVPAPDLYIVCRCPAEICLKRVEKRPQRKYEKSYPLNHISKLEEYYAKLTFEDQVPRVEIDTMYYDFSKSGVLEFVCDRIIEHLENHIPNDQLSLFEESVTVEDEIPGLNFYNFDFYDASVVFPNQRKEKGYVYLAAPFSQLATDNNVGTTDTESDYNLFSSFEDNTYGALPSRYRNQLIRIKQSVEKASGLSVMLPHRDINNWGKTYYPTEFITPRITEGVANASAIVAIPGNSLGVHMELGIAIAKGIPVVVFDTKDFPGSFFVKGFRSFPNVIYIQAEAISDIPNLLLSESISTFIRPDKHINGSQE